MSPNRRGGARRKTAKGRDVGMRKRTSECLTSVRNLGSKSPRVPGMHNMGEKTGTSLPVLRDERESLPSHRRLMSLLTMAVVPEEREPFRQRFWQAMKDEDGRCCEFLCNTPISVVGKAFECKPLQLRCAADMFPGSGMQSEFLNEFYVMDVILNRAPSPPAVMSTNVEQNGGMSDDGFTGVEYDVVRHVLAYDEMEDLRPEKDYLYRAAILFLPQCGVFYCHRERRRGDVGLPGTMVAHDMSWLRLRRDVDGSYSFGADSFVRRFYSETRGCREYYGPRHLNQFRYLGDNCRVSAWRINTGYRHCSLQNRRVIRALQCHDADGPMLPPDFIGGCDLRTVPADYRAAEYRNSLREANSAREGGRHYVDGGLHYVLPESCLLVDPMETHVVDIHVGIEKPKSDGGLVDRESVVMIRNVMKIDAHDDHAELLARLTSRCVELRLSAAKPSARNRSADVGAMYALGTRVPMEKTVDSEGVPTVCPYAANGCVAEDVLRDLVVSLASLGSRCFPQVYSVIRDTEANSGAIPVSPMDGEPAQSSRKCDAGGSLDANDGEDAGEDVEDGGMATSGGLRRRELVAALRRKIRMMECRRRVGYTIDMSVNLGNSSHFDVHDASQGYSVWTEEVRGRGANWYLFLPNVHGYKPDGTRFFGLAIKLGHGVAISWDGRKIRHCTSVSHPDGIQNGMVGGGWAHFENHLYGTFTAAKEKIVQVGRAQSAAAYHAANLSAVDEDVVDVDEDDNAGGRRRKNKRRRRKPRKKATPSDVEVDVETKGLAVVIPRAMLVAANEYPGCLAACVAADPHCPVDTGNRRKVKHGELVSHDAIPGRNVVPDGERPGGISGTMSSGGLLVAAVDLDVGGSYRIPKKTKK
jgi:hypothetical protein